jgi:PhoPQ-activated pathogenicity-related protein
MVPNQPLVFNGDGQKLSEDAITAFSWEKFLTSGDETWPFRLPMTKSVVRAMDTITSSFARAPQMVASPSTGLCWAARHKEAGRRGPPPRSTAASPPSSLS